jgi:uncharacterized protein YegL
MKAKKLTGKKKGNNTMTKKKTYVAIILDRSGSMQSTKLQAVQSYNEQVQQMKQNAKDQEIFSSLVTFNGDVFEHLWCEPAEKLQESSAENYFPDGATAMRDAIGYTIDKLQATTKADDDTAYLVLIISDGEENSSKKYTVGALNEQIRSLQRTGKWTFTYMGCSEQYLEEISRQTSIPVSNMAVWSNSTREKARYCFRATNAKIGSYYTERAKGMVMQDAVLSEDAVKCANFDADFDAGVEVAGMPPMGDVNNLTSSNLADVFGNAVKVSL